MRWAVPATSMPSAAVANATRAASDVAVARESTTTVGTSSSSSAATMRAASTSLALGLAREAAREVDRSGEPRLPGEHVLGAAGVAVGAEAERDRVAVTGEVAHE